MLVKRFSIVCSIKFTRICKNKLISRCLFCYCYKLINSNFKTCITCRFVNEHCAYKFGQFEYICESKK